MADKRLKQTKKIFVETEYDNIILVDPNQIYDENNQAAPRLVDHEDLVYYANLETFIIPRTKLAIGESFDSPVVNTTVATLFQGDEDLKLNFLKPKGKTTFDTSWSDQLTGFESRLGNGANQKTEQVVTIDGKSRFKNSVSKYEDTQMLGIKSIRVNVKGTGVPEVNIEMTDIQGRALFEQGDSSIYSAFFNFPYPLFYLTLKGYYGKAIRYRLSLLSFNARFDANTGNYDISLKLVGKFTALLFDTPLQYAVTAPKMYNTEITYRDNSNNTLQTKNTYKGRQKLDEVYDIYIRKGLIPEDFPKLSIDEFKNRVQDYAVKLQADAASNGDFSQLNDIQDYRETLQALRKSVYTNSVDKFLDKSSFYVSGDQKLIYYPFKKDIEDQTKEDYKTKIQERIIYYLGKLNNNKTFGKGGKYEIPLKIKNKNDVLKKLNFEAWFNNSNDLQNTYFSRFNKPVDLSTEQGKNDFEKFKLDEDKNKLLKEKVLNEKKEWVEDDTTYFVFGDKTISDGSYVPNSFLDDIDDAEKTLETNEEIIEKTLSQILADRALKDPSQGGLGFKPTIRNIFAIIFAGADAFYRLMEDTHQSAWDVRNETARLLAVIPPDKSFSVDGLNSIQSSSGTLDKDNVIYPWPLYFIKEKQADGRELYTIQYPGDSKVIKQTKAYDYRIWPEIGFVEAYLKGVTETSKPTSANVYNNLADYSSYVSANAIEFPFKTAPYQDLVAIPFFYELFERTYLSSYYTKFINEEISKKQIDKFYGDIESKNISNSIGNNIELNQILKNYKFNYNDFITYLKKISNSGQGESWQTYIRSKYKTEYIDNLLKSTNDIYSIDTLSNRSIKISSDLELSKNLKEYLESTDSSKISFLDTYPFTNLSWVSGNTSNGNTVGNVEQFNDTTKTFIYLDDKKTIARINETEKYTNLSLLTDFRTLNNGAQPYLSTTNSPINSQLALKNFYSGREIKDFYITESYVDYGNSYSGNVGTQIQTTSLLNTPYFINALVKGVDENKTNTDNAFTTLGYLFLNSLPLITTKEKIKSIENDVATDLDYLASTLKKYSAVHQVPYAWVLKYGSIWYRYKKYVNENVDILDSVWKNFDYVGSYDPITSGLTTQYTIPDYSGNSQTMVLQKTENFPIPSAQSKDFIGTGFYPKVINSVYNFVNGKDLFTGYTTNDFQNAYNNNNFRVGKNNQSNSYLNFGFDTLNPDRSLQKTNYYNYAEKSGTTQQYIMLFPSMGGIPIDQSIYECVNSNNILTKELINNNSLYNGSVRSLWSAPHFGYFDNSLLKKPTPTQYLKAIKLNTDSQTPFDLKSAQSEYASIEEIFSVFTPEMLDKFEEQFIGFCNYKPLSKNLILKEEIIDPSYTNSNKVANIAQKRLYNQLLGLFLVNKSGITFVNEDIDGKTLAQKQIATFTSSLKEFLNFDCVLKLGNPGNFDRRLFNSFSNLKEFVPEFEKYTFNPYIKGTLPGDGTNVTLLQSVTQNQDAWNTLRTYVGFSSIAGVDYPGQPNPAFPSTTITPSATTATTATTATSVTTSAITPSTHYTFQSCCSPNEIFNIVIPANTSDVVTTGSTYVEGEVYYIEAIESFAPNSTNFCVRKIANTTTFNPPTQPQTLFLIKTYTLDFDEYPFPNDANAAVKCLTYKIPSQNCLSQPQQQQNLTPQQQLPANQPQPVVPLSGTPKSTVADFFIDNDIEFTSDNVIKTYPLIRLYAQKKLDNPNLNKQTFTTLINQFLTDQKSIQEKILNQTFLNLNKDLNNITVKDNTTNSVTGDVGKLSLYNTLKGFNDKWIAGSDLKYVTLFEDFLFMDRANSDIGDVYVVDVDKIVKRLDTQNNPDMNLMTVVSNILGDNQFMFFAMPAYINFYGIQTAIKNGQAVDIEIPNSLFGTYLEVDYTKSSPKFLCLYMGNPSEYPKPKENSFIRFDDDSFDLRIPDNPLRISDPKRDYSKTNRVVGFSVDFGIQNQNMFKNLDLDMSEMKNTSESFKVFADIGSSVAGDKVAQQSVSMYSIYKSRSYSCGVESMGNVMIQPTMYFVLRHVPLFYGPYWIYEVDHNISENGFTTKFKGTRIPKYSLPKVDNLLINVNEKILQSYKEKIKKTNTPTSGETILNTDPTIKTTKTGIDVCKEKTKYTSLPFVEVKRTPLTNEELIPIIKAETTDSRIRALLHGIAITRPINSYQVDLSLLNSINNNLYEISTETKHNGSLDTYLKEQICVDILGTSVALASFLEISTPTKFMVSFYQSIIPLIESLKTLNVDTNEYKQYGKALAQICLTTWDSAVAFGPPALTAEVIKEKITTATNTDVINTYNNYVVVFTTLYENYFLNPN
jgi:hypothetical protein